MKLKRILSIVCLQMVTLGSSAMAADQAAAYHQQRLLVQSGLLTDSILGYKAGLTSATSQAMFGATEPVAGVLLES